MKLLLQFSVIIVETTVCRKLLLHRYNPCCVTCGTHCFRNYCDIINYVIACNSINSFFNCLFKEIIFNVKTSIVLPNNGFAICVSSKWWLLL
jgi:hypothetical protein